MLPINSVFLIFWTTPPPIDFKLGSYIPEDAAHQRIDCKLLWMSSSLKVRYEVFGL